MKDRGAGMRGVVLVNLQKRYVVRAASLSAFVRNLKRRLRLGNREFNICFVDDNAIRRLNSAYRAKDKATDVLAFPWNEAAGYLERGRNSKIAFRNSRAVGRISSFEFRVSARRGKPRSSSRRRQPWGMRNFLGEVVISVERARRNARAEGHSTLNEIRWLILHGVLHLLGYDHERDTGEMTARELKLREQLGVAGWPPRRKRKVETRNSKLQTRKSKSPRR